MKLIWDGKSRVIGVEYLSAVDQYSQLRRVYCRRNGEVLLSAGAIGSPQLLLLSGLGPRRHLRDRGVALIRNLPNVGKNLQDQIYFTVSWKSKRPLFFPQTKKPSWLSMIDFHLFGKGPLSAFPFQASLHARSSACRLPEGIPDLQLLFAYVGMTPQPRSPSSSEDALDLSLDGNGFSIWVSLLHPESSGTVRLRSGSWRAGPYIDPHYLEHPADIAALLEGFKLARTIVAHPSFEDIREAELVDKELEQKNGGVSSDDYMLAYIKKRVTSFSQAVGTCYMGEEGDEDAVVDPSLRVNYVEGLRVIDASVFPTLVSGSVSATCILLAERASEVIKAERKRPLQAQL